MATQEFDQVSAERFAERMVDVLNEGAIALMTSIGHRTGLFDAMAGLPPSTSEEIASAAELNERYVREWLGAMVVARSSSTIRRKGRTVCPKSTLPSSLGQLRQTTSPPSPSTSRYWD